MDYLQNEILEEVKEDFKVNDLQGANWCFRKIDANMVKLSEIKALAETEIIRINTWLDRETRQLEYNISYFEGLIKEYYIKQRELDKKFKLTTPYGKVTARKSKKFIYEDEQAIIDFCNMNKLDCIEVVEKLNKTELKKLCKEGVNNETGEIVPGVKVEEVTTISVKSGGNE